MYAAVVVIRSDGVEDRWALRPLPPRPDALTVSEEYLEVLRRERGEDRLGEEPATLVPWSQFNDGVIDYHVDPGGSLLIYQTSSGQVSDMREMARYAPGAWIRAQRVRPRVRDSLAFSEATERAWRRASEARKE